MNRYEQIFKGTQTKVYATWQTALLFGMSATLMLSGIGRSQTPSRLVTSNSAATNAQLATHRSPTLGTDMS